MNGIEKCARSSPTQQITTSQASAVSEWIGGGEDAHEGAV